MKMVVISILLALTASAYAQTVPTPVPVPTTTPVGINPDLQALHDLCIKPLTDHPHPMGNQPAGLPEVVPTYAPGSPWKPGMEFCGKVLSDWQKAVAAVNDPAVAAALTLARKLGYAK